MPRYNDAHADQRYWSPAKLIRELAKHTEPTEYTEAIFATMWARYVDKVRIHPRKPKTTIPARKDKDEYSQTAEAQSMRRMREERRVNREDYVYELRQHEKLVSVNHVSEPDLTNTNEAPISDAQERETTNEHDQD